MESIFLHVDDALIIAEKPAGLLAVPGRGPDKQDCLSARIQRRFPDALIHSALGRALMLDMSGFWVLRLIQQFVFLRVDHPLVHLLSMLFALGAALFALPIVR